MTLYILLLAWLIKRTKSDISSVARISSEDASYRDMKELFRDGLVKI